MYQFEIHAHTSEVSRCGRVAGAEMVRLYREAGYSGMVITDHVNPWTFQDLGLTGWEAKAQHFLKGYRAAKEAGGADFTVLLGAEFHFYENSNDYLVYGLTEELLCGELDDTILEWGIVRFSEFCRERGLLLIQAHPFRNNMVINPPNLVDGVEVMNGHPRHDSRNFLARAWAERYGLLMTSGSDAHQPEDAARGGILTESPILTMEALTAELRRGARLIVPDDMK